MKGSMKYVLLDKLLNRKEVRGKQMFTVQNVPSISFKEQEDSVLPCFSNITKAKIVPK